MTINLRDFDKLLTYMNKASLEEVISVRNLGALKEVDRKTTKEQEFVIYKHIHSDRFMMLAICLYPQVGHEKLRTYWEVEKFDGRVVTTETCSWLEIKGEGR